MRAPILAVGLAATSITAFVGFFLFYVVAVEYSEPLGYALTGAAIASTLFGGIAGAQADRWGPLITGCALAIAILVGMYSIVRLNY